MGNGRLGNPLAVAAVASSLKPGEKKALLIGGIALVAVAGYVIYRKIVLTKADTDKTEMEANLRYLTVKKKELTIDEGKAMLIAQQLFDAMNGVGTDAKTIHSVLEDVKTQADLLYVIRSFGVKQYGKFGEASSWIAKATGYSSPLNLSGWFKEELSGSDLERVRSVYKRLDVPF